MKQNGGLRCDKTLELLKNREKPLKCNDSYNSSTTRKEKLHLK